MSQQAHVLRLGPRRRHGSYFDKLTGLYLTYPERVEGEVPFGADLSRLYHSIKLGQLVDVNGTVAAEYEKNQKAQAAEETPAAPVVAKEEPAPQPEPTPADEPTDDVPEEQPEESKSEEESKTTAPRRRGRKTR